MKKLLYLLFVLLVGCLVSCDKEEPKEPQKPEPGQGDYKDYASFNYYVWKNESDHVISLSIKTTSSMIGENVAVLQPRDAHMINCLGFATLLPPHLGVDSLRVLFDEGPYEWTYGRRLNWFWQDECPDNYSILYDPTFEYMSEFERLELEEYPNCDVGRWTYTFTNADYDAVVSYWPWKEAQEQQTEEPEETK